MKLLACLLLLSSAAFAKTHAPLPDDLIQAKTIYIVNQTGKQEVLDTAYDQFTKWGRFAIAKNKENADIVAVFTREELAVGNTMMPFIAMNVMLKGSEDSAFQTINKWTILTNGPKNDVQDLRKRLEKK